MNYVKSKQRVADHGEVFTPAWLVEAMLDLVKDETERIDSRFLKPACGSGNFLVAILRRKLAAVEIKYGKSRFERQHYALLALMCCYGIELLADNIAECRRLHQNKRWTYGWPSPKTTRLFYGKV
nr:DNA methyltransferase [Chloroflexus sp.]